MIVQTWLRRLLRRMLRRPGYVVGAVLLVSALPAFWIATGLRIDNDIEIWLPKDDPELTRYQEFLARFGDDSMLVVAVDPIDWGDAETVSAVSDLERALRDSPAVRSVHGPEDPLAGETSLIGGAVADDAVAAGTPRQDPLLSPDGRALAMLVFPAATTDGSSAGFFDSVEEVVQASDLAERTRIAGPEAINHYLDLGSRRSFQRLFPLVLLLMAAVLWVAIRDLRLVVGILAVGGIATLWSLGLLAFAGRSLNMVVSTLPSLLMVLGTAYSLHLANALRGAPAGGMRERWALAIDDTFLPCLFTAVNTAGGLLALTLADLPPVRDLGWFGAAGVLIGFLLVFSFLPCLQLLVGGQTAAVAPRPVATRGATRKIWRMRVPILLSALCAVGLAWVGISRLTVESDILSFFPPDDPLVTATDVIEERILGLTPIEIWLHGPAESVLRPETVTAVRELLAFCLEQPDVTGAIGPLTDLDPVGVGRDGAEGQEGAEEMSAFAWLRAASDAGLLDGSAAADRWRLDEQGADARWTVAARTTSIERSETLLEAITTKARQSQPPGCSLTVTGAVPILVRMQAWLLRTQIRTFAVSVAVVTLLLALALRSFRLALLGLVPNLLPILMTLGAMGFLRIPLDAATVTVASIALGLVVDDTIHFLERLHRSRDAGLPMGERLDAVFRAVGRPIVITSLATSVGFIAFTAAAFQPLQRFGVLIAATSVSAVLCDLLVLPALMRETR